MVVEEKVIIKAEWIDALTGGVKKTLNSISTLNGGFKHITQDIQTFNKSGSSLVKMTKDIEKQSQKLSKIGLTPTTLTKEGHLLDKTGLALKKLQDVEMANQKGIKGLVYALKSFRMEMLSVMFFGMAMQRMFMGLLQPVMEVFGVFDLWRIMLQVLFIPIMQLLFPIFLAIMEWFIGLPEPAKLIIGVFVLLGLAVGSFLFILGVLVLGLSGLIMFFTGPIVAALGGVSGLFAFLGGIILTIIAIIAGLTLVIIGIIMIVKNWGKDWEKVFKGIGIAASGLAVILLAIFGLTPIGWIMIAIAAMAYLISYIIKHWTSIKMFFVNLWEDIKGIFKSAWDWIKSNVVDPLVNAFNKITGLGGGKLTTPVPSNISTGHDFIWRSGQSPMMVDPKDTIVGSKSNGFGGGNGIIINQTNSIYAMDKAEIERMIQNNNSKLVHEITRQVKI